MVDGATRRLRRRWRDGTGKLLEGRSFGSEDCGEGGGLARNRNDWEMILCWRDERRGGRCREFVGRLMYESLLLLLLPCKSGASFVVVW